MIQTYVLFQLAVTFLKSKMAAVSHLVLVGQPIDPIHEFCTKMDFLTQITYILMGHTYILPKIGILAILKNIWQPSWIL